MLVPPPPPPYSNRCFFPPPEAEPGVVGAAAAAAAASSCATRHALIFEAGLQAASLSLVAVVPMAVAMARRRFSKLEALTSP